MTHLKNSAKLVIIDSVWGHVGECRTSYSLRQFTEFMIGIAGGGGNSEDDKFVQAEVKKFIEETS